jgi:paraquat-inducible protein B
MGDPDGIPQAKIETRRRPYASRIWLLTVACLILAAALFLYASRIKGIPVTVQFLDGHGVSAGDLLKYRGIDVGEVVSVELGADLQQVAVRIDVDKAARGLAREGSQFWIERPVVQLTEVRGLETLLGGTHMAVLPGPPDAKPLREFTGLEIAPTGDLPEGGLEIVLEAPHIGGLGRSVPIKYRGMKIGHVVSVGLASDAATVEARGFIQPGYRHLIRTNSQFWNHSGLEFSLGITGLKVEAESLASIAFGGVEMATPNPPGESVNAGQRFTIHEKPHEEWLSAQPSLSGATHLLPAGLTLPVPVRVAVQWQQRTFGIKRNRQRLGWVLPLQDGRLLGPADLLAPVAEAMDDQSHLEMAGSRVPLTADRSQTLGRLAVYLALPELRSLPDSWPLDRIRAPDSPEDCLVVTESGEPIVLSAARLAADENDWQINLATPIDSDCRGGSIIAVSDGSLVGFLVFDEGRALVATVPDSVLSSQ